MQSVAKKKGAFEQFGDAARYYHSNATVQKEVATRLLNSLKPWKEILPRGPIIELGSGTGFLSEGLIDLFPDRELIITDASQKMVEVCQDNIPAHENISFQKLDARQVPVDEPAYAMSISNFVAQWFNNSPYTLAKWLEATKPGGLMLAAFPGSESFPEWKKHAEGLGLPFTANALPDTEEMVVKLSSSITQVDYHEDTVTQTFASAADFFRHLKRIGAGRQLNGRHLTVKEMKLLINHWDAQSEGDITVRWHVVFLAVKKNLA